ncbi:hypothetical protein FHT44_004964 [Mycolicibacterium sp. BK634]|nr:hypothetical protein [Mycolicibacterium sp. BK634]
MTEAKAQYAVRDEYGLDEWSCGCPRFFSSVEELLDWGNLEPEDTIVRRYVTETPWEVVSVALSPGGQ